MARKSSRLPDPRIADQVSAGSLRSALPASAFPSKTAPVRAPAVQRWAPAPKPELVFSVAAWLKLQFLCHLGQTEIGAFAVTPAGHPLYVEDVLTVRQSCTPVTVEFDDQAVADFFEDQVDLGRTPEQFARIWIHTHPGESPEPSGTDEQTFARVFGRCSWAVMFILARGGAVFCRLRVTAERPRCDSTGPDGDAGAAPPPITLSQAIPVRIDHASLARSVPVLDPEAWRAEYGRNVEVCSGWGEHDAWWDRPERRPPSTRPPDEDEVEAALDWFDELDTVQQELFLQHAAAGKIGLEREGSDGHPGLELEDMEVDDAD